jgi:cobalt-zinc-cadmium efflux system membrane fusion protein
VRLLPTVCVAAALAGLAYWGHQNDWTLPKFSAIAADNHGEVELWCEEHNVREDECIECNKDLVPLGPSYGWCKTHGVTQCPWEHPDVAQLTNPPDVTPVSLSQAERALALVPRPENNSRCTLHQKRIQFASTQAIEKIGLEISVVHERPLVEAVAANGEAIYDQTRMARVSSRVGGTVWRVDKQVGDRVQQGEVLALVDAADVGRAKSDFLQAVAQLRLKEANLDRLKPLASDGTVAGRQLRESQAAFDEARIQLQKAEQALVNLGLPVRLSDFPDRNTADIAAAIQFLGLPSDLAAGLERRSTTSNLFPIRSPLAGTIIGRKIVDGEVIDNASTLFEVAEVERMWLVLDVRQEDAKYVAVGQKVLFAPGTVSEPAQIEGTVSWISTAADHETRTVKVRADLPNADRHLRANTFGTGRIVLREEPKAMVVPSEAVHWDGNCQVVFVRDKNYHQPNAPKFFHVRSVRTGVKNGDQVEILAGLLPGEIIASKNSVVLEAQLLKSSLGAGCGCPDGH